MKNKRLLSKHAWFKISIAHFALAGLISLVLFSFLRICNNYRGQAKCGNLALRTFHTVVSMPWAFMHAPSILQDFKGTAFRHTQFLFNLSRTHPWHESYISLFLTLTCSVPPTHFLFSCYSEFFLYLKQYQVIQLSVILDWLVFSLHPKQCTTFFFSFCRVKT